MSLVGPRPIRQVEIKDAVTRYDNNINRYIKQSLLVKPGLTGPWQVSGRNDVPWEARIKMDAQYASNKSLLEDILIILRTPLAMISKW